MVRGKRIDDGEWVYGYLFENITSTRHLSYIIEGGFVPSVSMPNYRFIEVIPKTVGRYSGLKDKNGKEICEDDIVIIDIPKTDNFKAAIIYKNGSFWIDDLMPQLLGDYNKNINIISNMWENPGLLKGETK